MNIYDEAYALAKALKESDEQKCLVEAEKALKTNPDAKKMTAEYLVLQQKVSYLQMMHEKDKAEKNIRNCRTWLYLSATMNWPPPMYRPLSAGIR